MTVGELIKMLQEFPPELEVLLDMTNDEDELFHFAGIAMVDAVELPEHGNFKEETVVLLSAVNYEEFEEDKSLYN